MARSFASASSQYLINTSWTLSAEPLTLACWGYPLQTNAFCNGIAIPASTGSGRYFVAYGATAKVLANKDNGTAGNTATTTASYSANEWSHICGVFASDTSRTVYLNGANAVTTTVSISDPTAASVSIGGRLLDGSPNGPMNGYIAHAAAWSAALTAAEVAALYNNGIGLDPRSIRPDALVAYWPLLDNDGDRDWWGPWHMTATNAPTYTQHPPVLMKSRPTVVVLAGSSAPTISSVTVSGTRQIGQTLTASVATSPASVDSIAYQWEASSTGVGAGTDITGATASTLALTYDDFGPYLDTAAYVRCGAIATVGASSSDETFSDWQTVTVPSGGAAGGSLLESSLIR